jgi:stearoyl-CoA desaturase (delta-9 desaturase)
VNLSGAVSKGGPFPLATAMMAHLMTVVIVFLVHWHLSVFCQSFFLHRYGAHRQFSMSRGWERFFNVLTALSQNSSYLNPRGYAILHRMHHAYSDDARDPHSPKDYGAIIPGLFRMMMRTKHIYHQIAYFEVEPEARFDGWQWALLPGHWIMGAVHGAIVNWSGHRYGYRNFPNDDVSRNSLPVDFLTAGELYQNNHHKYPMSANFAVRWFELDTTYQIMRVLNWLGVIDMKGAQVARYGPATTQTST